MRCPKSNGFDVGCRSGATPWPDTWITCGEITALSLNETVPNTPLSSLGVNVRVIGQVAPGAIDPQLCAAAMVETEDVMEVMSSAALPQLVIVTVWLEEDPAVV